MPFDGRELGRNERMLYQLGEVIELLRREDKWCQHQMKTKDDRRCILGALMHVGANAAVADAILGAAEEITGKAYRGVEAFNDDPDTDHRLVIAVLNRSRDHLLLAETPFCSEPARPNRRWSACGNAGRGSQCERFATLAFDGRLTYRLALGMESPLNRRKADDSYCWLMQREASCCLIPERRTRALHPA